MMRISHRLRLGRTGVIALGCGLVAWAVAGWSPPKFAFGRPRDGGCDPKACVKEAATAMKAFRNAHGAYASEWRLLDFDRFDRPTQQNIEWWQPSGHDVVYKIVAADRDHFLIQALNWDDRPIAEIRDGMAEPVDLPGANAPLARLNPDVPEPRQFLPVAAAAMDAFRRKEMSYATRWDLLEVAFSAIPYHIYNEDVRPAWYGDNQWRPRGCEYTYKIVSADKEHFLIQAYRWNNVAEYEIREGLAEAKSVQKAGPLAGRGTRN